MDLDFLLKVFGLLSAVLAILPFFVDVTNKIKITMRAFAFLFALMFVGSFIPVWMAGHAAPSPEPATASPYIQVNGNGDVVLGDKNEYYNNETTINQSNSVPSTGRPSAVATPTPQIVYVTQPPAPASVATPAPTPAPAVTPAPLQNDLTVDLPVFYDIDYNPITYPSPQEVTFDVSCENYPEYDTFSLYYYGTNTNYEDIYLGEGLDCPFTANIMPGSYYLTAISNNDGARHFSTPFTVPEEGQSWVYPPSFWADETCAVSFYCENDASVSDFTVTHTFPSGQSETFFSSSFSELFLDMNYGSHRFDFSTPDGRTGAFYVNCSVPFSHQSFGFYLSG